MEEHPDVFSDPNFSITRLDTPTTPPPDRYCAADPNSLDAGLVSVAMSLGEGEEQEAEPQWNQAQAEKRVVWVSGQVVCVCLFVC